MVQPASLSGRQRTNIVILFVPRIQALIKELGSFLLLRLSELLRVELPLSPRELHSTQPPLCPRAEKPARAGSRHKVRALTGRGLSQKAITADNRSTGKETQRTRGGPLLTPVRQVSANPAFTMGNTVIAVGESQLQTRSTRGLNHTCISGTSLGV